MVRNLARAMWARPRAPDPPSPQWWDRALVAALVVGSVVEGLVREDLVWRPVSILLVVVLAPALFWRRQHPLGAVVAAFGATITIDIASILAGAAWVGLDVQAVMLLLIYSLFRWGSGRETAIGVWFLAVAVLLSLSDGHPVEDLVGGAVVVFLASELGVVFRYRDRERRRALDQVKVLEREQLARELHDSVAHHVSAIAVQAQAGRTVASSRPDAAVAALAVVEAEASRALAEMRAIVGALRDGGAPELAPQPGVADLHGFTRHNGHPPSVRVTVTGEVDELPPPVDAALYRLAQESVTNALRHARDASTVEVVVTGDRDVVRLSVRDDGAAVPAGGPASPGFGLLGMAERARLLGGTFAAGPEDGGGWAVEAALPRIGAPDPTWSAP